MRIPYALYLLYLTHKMHIRNLNEGLSRKKRNDFCLETPCFAWFPSTFCPEFCFSLSEETEEETFCLADAAFFAIFIFWIFFGIPISYCSYD